MAKKAPKKWTVASDHAWDKAHGIKQGSPQDQKLDAERGLDMKKKLKNPSK